MIPPGILHYESENSSGVTHTQKAAIFNEIMEVAMNRKSIFRDPDLCVDCKACIIACKVKNAWNPYSRPTAVAEPKAVNLRALLCKIYKVKEGDPLYDPIR